MNKVKNRVILHGSFEQIEPHNSSFLRTKIRVFAFGDNQNMSSINQSSFEKAKPSIFNIPIVAKYNVENDDLEGHNPTIKKTDDGWIYYYDTYPIGVVSSDANISFEQVEETIGDETSVKTYVVIDNVYLWRRYDATKKIKEWIDTGVQAQVSMEIGEIEGQFNEDGFFVFTSWQFEAIAALGTEVEACFPMAEIQEYSKDKFKDSYYEMLKELKESVSDEELDTGLKEVANFNKGGQNVLDKLLEKYSVTKEQLTEKGINFAELSLEDLEVKIQEFTKDEETDTPEDTKEEFSLTTEQTREELMMALSEVDQETDEWGWTYSRYYYIDWKDSSVFAYDSKDNWKIVGFSFATNEDKITVDFDSRKRYKIEFAPFEGEDETQEFGLVPQDLVDYQFKTKESTLKKDFASEKETAVQEVQSQLDTYKEKFSTIENEAKELREFQDGILSAKRKDEEEELFSSFAEKLTEDEMKPVKDKITEYENLEDAEKDLALIFSRKSVNFSKKSKSKESVKVYIDGGDDKKVDPSKPSWAYIVEENVGK